MKNFKHITNISFGMLLAMVACSTKNEKQTIADKYYSDTTYISGTEQFKSNRIPDSVFKMTQLRHLSISGMDCDDGNRKNCWMIEEIQPQISNLKNLTTLSLTLNAISTIPNELTALKHLSLLDLTDSPGLTNIENLARLENLQYLYLYGCGLKKLPNNIGELKKLKELGLAGNNIDNAEKNRIKNALPNCAIKF